MARIIVKAMIGASLLAALIAERLSAATGASFLLCGIPMFIISVIGTVWLAWKRCYRPDENHVGVVYRSGRFHRFIAPEAWTFLWPYLDAVHHEVSLYMRTAELSLSSVELRDGLNVDAKFKIFFVTDPRLANSEHLLQALKFRGAEWSEIVKTSAEDIIRNQVFLTLTYGELVDLRESREIKRLLSKEITARLKSFGIVINEGHGVMPLVVQPNNVYRDAIQTSKAARPLGEAAYERLRPVLDVLNRLRAEDAQSTLLLEIASKIVETGELPEIVLSPLSDLPVSPILGAGNNGGSGGPKRPASQHPSTRKLPRAE